jgi:hypothetical protein
MRKPFILKNKEKSNKNVIAKVEKIKTENKREID